MSEVQSSLPAKNEDSKTTSHRIVSKSSLRDTQREIKDSEGVNGHSKCGAEGENTNIPLSPSSEKNDQTPLAVRKASQKGRKSSSRKYSERERSLYGVIPHCQFGPKAKLTAQTFLQIPDPSSQRLMWTSPPESVLVIHKHHDPNVILPFSKMVAWLVQEKNLKVVVEQHALEELGATMEFSAVQDNVNSFTEGKDELDNKVDFVICLGGDGTLLYASSLFQVEVPPVMAFNMGSLGFLTPFQFDQDFRENVTKVMEGSPSVLLHYRLKCVLVSSGSTVPHIKDIKKENSSVKVKKMVLNEVVVDRGQSSYLTNFEIYIENRMVTSVQGDGLIISTPTGSTAYAVAAGASMVHPSVPCILITPICPHSLSFRPIVVPAGVEIKIKLSPNARNNSMVSFDGRDRLEMSQEDILLITTAFYPVPSICAVDQIKDWFDSLAVCLNWNVRRPQKALETSSSCTSVDSLDSEANGTNSTISH